MLMHANSGADLVECIAGGGLHARTENSKHVTHLTNGLDEAPIAVAPRALVPTSLLQWPLHIPWAPSTLPAPASQPAPPQPPSDASR